MTWSRSKWEKKIEALWVRVDRLAAKAEAAYEAGDLRKAENYDVAHGALLQRIEELASEVMVDPGVDWEMEDRGEYELLIELAADYHEFKSKNLSRRFGYEDSVDGFGQFLRTRYGYRLKISVTNDDLVEIAKEAYKRVRSIRFRYQTQSHGLDQKRWREK